MSPVIITPIESAGAGLPVSTAEAKAHMRVSITDDDSLIDGLISAATNDIEKRLRRKLIEETVTYSLDSFPGFAETILLPWAPLQSVTSIAYTDTQGDSQTLSSSYYQVSTSGITGRIAPVYGQTWPATYPQLDAVVITYVAGYGDEASDVPQNIRMAVKTLVAHWYENREAVVTGMVSNDVAKTLDYLLAREKVPTVWRYAT